MKKSLFFILIILFFGVFLSCSKSKEKKLVGTWELVNIAVDETKTTTWTFYDSDLLIVNETIADSVSSNSTVDSALYELNERFFKYYIQISNYSDSKDGSYHIDKLNNSVLILQCQSPNYSRNEFVKK